MSRADILQFAPFCRLVSLQAHQANGARKAIRFLLFFYATVLLCPIRYWALKGEVDNTWVFALNHAAVHGLVFGRDVVWTTGPLGFLAFPQNIGSNLIQGLHFQALLWLGLIAVLHDLFWRCDFPLGNLALFSLFLGLSEPLYWFNYMGAENLLLAGVLILLVVYRWSDGRFRYVAALIFIGIIPLIKISGGILVAGALAGFLIDRARCNYANAMRELGLALIIPPLVAIAACLTFLPSSASLIPFHPYAFIEIVRGYSSAMSSGGPLWEVIAAAEAVILFAGVLWIQSATSRSAAGCYALLFAIPLFFSIKHGFVRQDGHLIDFFCFVALAIALVCLTTPYRAPSAAMMPTLLICFGVLWQDHVIPSATGVRAAAEMVTGARSASFAWKALCPSCLQNRLNTESAASVTSTRLEPEIRRMIGSSPVAPLSIIFSYALADDLNLMLYPVVQRYGAYTPYLDELNARWIFEQGPRFLVFDGSTIDARNIWAETPAMWREVYRWYDTLALGSRNLLLQRRRDPRFTRFESVGLLRTSLAKEIPIPVSRIVPVFWTVKCASSAKGALLRMWWRSPAVNISITEAGGRTRFGRVIPELLASPVMGTYLPSDLEELATVFQPDTAPSYSVERIAFSGPGLTSFSSNCDLEYLRPVLLNAR